MAFRALFWTNAGNEKEKTFEEKTPYEKGFSAYYEEHIKPLQQAIEEERLRCLRSFRLRSWITAIIIAAIATYLLLYLDEVQHNQNHVQIAFIIAIALVPIAFFLIRSPLNQYKGMVKHYVYAKLIDFLGGFRYVPEGDMVIESLQPSHIIPAYDRYHTEDCIYGNYKEVEIGISEVHLEERHVSYDSKGRRREYYRTLFKGLFVQLEMNKPFIGRTIISRDQGFLANWAKNLFSGMERVKLEDPTFEKLFEVYSTDQVEARYLLTTAFMERLLRLSELFLEVERKGMKFYQKLTRFGRASFNKALHCSFYDDKLLITIPCAWNLFEPPPIHKPALQIEDIRKFIEEINLVFQIVDILKLNLRIGL